VHELLVGVAQVEPEELVAREPGLDVLDRRRADLVNARRVDEGAA
jgi:hypothetical protein